MGQPVHPAHRRGVRGVRARGPRPRAGQAPDEEVYILRLRHTGCAWIFADLTELARRTELDVLVAGGAAYRELIEAGADIAGWDNDVVSLPREQAVGEVNNLILIVAGSGGDVEAAIARVKARIHARAADYDRAESVLVGQFSPHDPQIEQVRALRDTLNGVLAWNRAGGRFR